jgi:hypothetical protein
MLRLQFFMDALEAAFPRDARGDHAAGELEFS